MEQFEIIRYLDWRPFGIDASITNSAIMMLIAVGLLTAFFLFATRKRAIVPGRLQSVAELAHDYVADMLRNSTGEAGMRFFPLVFTIFLFVLTLNMLGLIPYSFTSTSHIIVTFAMALAIFVLATLVGFYLHGFGYLRMFAPAGVPIWLMPVLVPIEIISYMIRPITLSVRLFANMLAGHTMLKVFGGFVVLLSGTFFGVAAIAPLLFTTAFTGLELLVAFLQALIFTMLTCIYLNDAINMHH